MREINIINREMTTDEVDQMNVGFDQLSLEEDVALESSDRLSFVAMKDGIFIGCASGLANKNGENYSGWFFLADLYVKKKYRSKGIGFELLKALEAKAISIGVKYIWLWTSGEKALRFYARYGYHKFTEMENWYSDGSSRVGLRKNL